MLTKYHTKICHYAAECSSDREKTNTTNVRDGTFDGVWTRAVGRSLSYDVSYAAPPPPRSRRSRIIPGHAVLLSFDLGHTCSRRETTVRRLVLEEEIVQRVSGPRQSSNGTTRRRLEARRERRLNYTDDVQTCGSCCVTRDWFFILL